MSNKKIPKSILYVCSGNTCRSPMAEYMTRAMAEEKGLEIVVASRGISAHGGNTFGLGVSKEACEGVLEIIPGSKIYLHQPTQLKFIDVEEDRLILTMEESQRDRIIKEAGKYIAGLENTVFTLKERAGLWLEDKSVSLNISDPMGGRAIVSYGAVDYNNDDFSSSTGSNGSNRYKECRDEILWSVKKIISGKIPTVSEVLNYRNERIIEIEVGRYEKVLDSIRTEKEKKEIEIDDSIHDMINGVECKGKEPPKHLKEIIATILTEAQERGVTLEKKKYVYHTSQSSYTPRTSLGRAASAEASTPSSNDSESPTTKVSACGETVLLTGPPKMPNKEEMDWLGISD